MSGVNIYGQMVRAQLEQWSANPTAGVTGRIGYNSVTNRMQLDTGSVIANVLTDQYTASANYLLNSDLSIWQRGTSFTVTSAANPTSTPTYKYGPDRFYVNNVIGGGTIEGIITISQVAAVTNGSAFGCKVQITTAPTGTNIQNGCEIYQVLENLDSIQFYNQSASFGVLVKAFGNVNSIGVQFFSATTEVKPTTPIGPEVNTTVNSSTFSLCGIVGQALGTAQTKAGVIGVRIRITGVSTGNPYDVNNGFVIEQPFLNLGGNLGVWSRKSRIFADELATCQRFCEKRGAEGSSGGWFGNAIVYTSTSVNMTTPYQVHKRALPTMSYSSQSAWVFGNPTTNYAVSAITVYAAGLDFAIHTLTVATIALGAGTSGIVSSTSPGTSFMIIDAEI